MQKKLSIKSAFAALLCLSLAVILADKSLYSETLSAGIWDLPFTKPASIWRALSYNYEMEPANSDQSSVTAEIHWFQKHQDYITELTHNAQPYIYYVYQQLQKRHMPAELALLPMVESSYQPFESSNVGATGLWQMMPDTASGLGLKAWGADGRRNVIASTDAALKYLAYLHRTFGSWPLALAAYNAGEGTVQNAIQRNLKHHLPTNFWSLHLPKQTEEYVPKLLALAAIVQDPQRYNVHLEPVANKAYFGAVKVNQKINLADVAKLSDSDTKTIQKLNPGIKSTSAPIPKHANYLLVPVDKLPVLQANLKEAKVLPPATLKPLASQKTPAHVAATQTSAPKAADKKEATPVATTLHTDATSAPKAAPKKDHVDHKATVHATAGATSSHTSSDEAQPEHDKAAPAATHKSDAKHDKATPAAATHQPHAKHDAGPATHKSHAKTASKKAHSTTTAHSSKHNGSKSVTHHANADKHAKSKAHSRAHQQHAHKKSPSSHASAHPKHKNS